MDCQPNDVFYVRCTRDASGTIMPVPDFDLCNQTPGIEYIWGPQVSTNSNVMEWDGSYSSGEFDFDLGMDSKSLFHEGMGSSAQLSALPVTQSLLPSATPPTDKTTAFQTPFTFIDSPVTTPPLSPSSSISLSDLVVDGPTSTRSRSSTASHFSLAAPTFPLPTVLHNALPTITTTSLPTNIPTSTMFQTSSAQYDSPIDECFDSFMASLYQPIPQPSESTNLATVFMQSDQFPLRTLLDNILTSPWLLMHGTEPKDEKNRSVLLGFLSHEAAGGTYRCLFDGCHKSLDRQDRALGHIRMHVGHRPHACKGICGVPECQERFYCQSYLRSHVKRQKTPCDICQQFFFRRDLRKHRLSCQGIQNQAHCMPHYGTAPAHARSARSVGVVGYGQSA